MKEFLDWISDVEQEAKYNKKLGYESFWSGFLYAFSRLREYLEHKPMYEKPLEEKKPVVREKSLDYYFWLGQEGKKEKHQESVDEYKEQLPRVFLGHN